MAVQLRLGSGLFEKEKQIQDWRQRVQKSETEREILLKEKNALQFMLDDHEKRSLKLSNTQKVSDLELQNAKRKAGELDSENKQLKEMNMQMSNSLKEGVVKMHAMQETIQELTDKHLLSQNTADRFWNEASHFEEKARKLETQLDKLSNLLQQKQENILLLEKSIHQKDKHIAIITKEKDRILKQRPFDNNNSDSTDSSTVSMAMTDKNHKLKNNSQKYQEFVSLINKENCNTIRNKKYDNDDLLHQLKQCEDAIQQKEKQIAKLVIENSQLVVRLKNKGHTKK